MDLLLFADPRTHHAGGSHHEHGRLVQAACLVRGRRQRKHLHRLAQTHVVGQDAAQSGPPQAHHPRVPLHLVGAKGCPQTRRRRR